MKEERKEGRKEEKERGERNRRKELMEKGRTVYYSGSLERQMRKDLVGELAHTIMEAEESHNRPSAGWRPGMPVAVSCPGLKA
jgi:hypothetical protein